MEKGEGAKRERERELCAGWRGKDSLASFVAAAAWPAPRRRRLPSATLPRGEKLRKSAPKSRVRDLRRALLALFFDTEAGPANRLPFVFGLVGGDGAAIQEDAAGMAAFGEHPPILSAPPRRKGGCGFSLVAPFFRKRIDTFVSV